MDLPDPTITIQARPAPFTMALENTAVIVVDMQNDFGAEGGMFHRGGRDISVIRETVAPTARVLAAARLAGVKVVYLKMEFRPDLSAVGAVKIRRPWQHHIGEVIGAPDGTEGRILVQDTWNTQVLPELAPEAGDIIVSKRRYSGFRGTDLDLILRCLQVQCLVVTGCTTSICVESTVRDAAMRDYACVVLADCVAEPLARGWPVSTHETSLFIMQRSFASVSDSAELLKAFAALVRGPVW